MGVQEVAHGTEDAQHHEWAPRGGETGKRVCRAGSCGAARRIARPGSTRGKPVNNRSKHGFDAVQHVVPFSSSFLRVPREALRARNWGPVVNRAAASPPVNGPAQLPARNAPQPVHGAVVSAQTMIGTAIATATPIPSTSI